MKTLSDLLQRRFAAERSLDLDMTVRLNWQSGELDLALRGGELTIYPEPQSPPPDLILYFSSLQHTCQILNGELHPVQAFMAGQFRSSGYIMWAFQTLGAFSKQAPQEGS